MNGKEDRRIAQAIENDAFVLEVLKAGRYMVDARGVIFRRGLRHGAWLAVSGTLRPSGYVQVWMKSDQGVEKILRAHRVVALASCGEPPFPGAQVNHRNGVKHDNRPENLEWTTCRENIRHAWDTGLKAGCSSGSRNPNAKLDERRVEMIRVLLQSRFTHSDIGRAFGISRSVVSLLAKGKCWRGSSPDR